jgi:ABC-2 type transport system ATP-binding protein
MTIRIENLVKRYKGKTALDGLTLSVGQGEIYGFIGPNGAGKTTTMSILAGIIRYDSGICEIDGIEPGARDRLSRVRTGYLPEDPVFAPLLSGREYLAMIAGILGRNGRRNQAAGLLERVGLNEAADRRIGGYSRGMRQRLGLACALLGDPGILILDEPSSALDPEGRKGVTDLIRELKAEGKTVFLSTHILSDIERICDRIALIDRGRVIVSGTIGQLLNGGFADRIALKFSRPVTEAENDGLRSLPFVERVDSENGETAIRLAPRGRDPDAVRVGLLRKIADLSLPLISLSPVQPTLEDLFLREVERHE